VSHDCCPYDGHKNWKGRGVSTKTLMSCMELGRTLSHKVNPDALLFKVTKVSETTKKTNKCKKREVMKVLMWRI
jgi:hypothetical protein